MLTADKAFGPADPAKFQKLPRNQSFAKVIRIPAEEYVKRFSSFPTIGKEVALMPYFPSRVTEVGEKDVALEFQVTDGAVFSDSFGSLAVAVSGGKITSTLSPQVGAAFPLKEGFGVVTAMDAESFTIDLNHPLAGKNLTIDIEAVSVTPASTTDTGVPWIDNHDAGLARAKQDGKPVFLILHADWCSWCKKTFTETIPDPRIAALKDQFVWVRVNSDKEQNYKQLYGQEGFPMMVLLKADGTVLKKIDGYRDARALREEIKAVLH
jgi:FKBP-type peptidyl-prolyl cis-trans isomerase 2